jgi:protein O-GlcNAc transferase
MKFYLNCFIYLTIVLINYLKLINCLTIPSLPFEHIKYWLRSNRNEYKLLKNLCDSQTYDSIHFESNSYLIINSNNYFNRLLFFSSIKIAINNETNNELEINYKKLVCFELEKVETKCWGYESDTNDCDQQNIYLRPECPQDSNGWAHNKLEQLKVFYDSADFGSVRQRIQELKHFCRPKLRDKSIDNLLISSLECTQYLRYCSAKNILIDFELLSTIDEPMRYREDVIGTQHIGGWNCVLNKKALKSEGQHKSPLQSWFAEIENFQVFSDDKTCDLWIERPTFIMKLDATVNMYHHFCDFINLYASLHMNNSFSVDNNIIIWDTYPYRSNFGSVWNAFTRNPILNLGLFRGKKVCFRDVIFPLLPRMIYGIYYNMPLIPGCHKSGLFHAFNRHLIHRLNIKAIIPEDKEEVRITLISRRTKYRQILNEQELVTALRTNLTKVSVEIYDFNHRMPFLDQISISSNSDVLIGIHGAGLTHTLLQPDWGVLFELYNCNDEHCYKDLARLRGVKYMTWTQDDKVFPETTDYKSENSHFSADAKFTNYRFDVKEFLRLVMIAVNYVREQRNLFIDNNDKSFDDQKLVKTEL